MSTGFPEADAKADFARERRRRALSQHRRAAAPRARRRVAPCCRSRRSSAALGRRSERDLGVQRIPLDSIVGTVDRRRGEFDRAFRPARRACAGAGSGSPPRAGAARRCRRSTSTGSASCTSSRTATTACRSRGRWATRTSRRTCARCRQARRRPRAAAARPAAQAARARLPRARAAPARGARADPALRRVALRELATLIESWGFRASHARERLLSREEMARRGSARSTSRWSRCCARPTSAARAPRPSATCASPCCASCCSTRTSWTDEVVERLLGEVARRPGGEDDTMVHQILKEMR